MVRFTIFVDGSNLNGSLKNLGLFVDDYDKFFKFILDQALSLWRASIISGSVDVRLVRVLWYEVGSIDEWDLNNPKVKTQIRDWFNKNGDLKSVYLAKVGAGLKGKGFEVIADEAWELCFSEITTWYNQKKDYVNGLRDFHFGVRSHTDFIDIIECGHLKVDILDRRIDEKGLDTFLAVDMVALADTYDVALVVSGDADSIPSVQRIKQKGKHVGVIEFIRGYPPEKKGRESSSKLKAEADFVIPIYEVDLQQKGVASTKKRT